MNNMLRRRPNNAAIIRAFPKYSDRHDGAHLYAMQYPIVLETSHSEYSVTMPSLK